MPFDNPIFRLLKQNEFAIIKSRLSLHRKMIPAYEKAIRNSLNIPDSEKNRRREGSDTNMLWKHVETLFSAPYLQKVMLSPKSGPSYVRSKIIQFTGQSIEATGHLDGLQDLMLTLIKINYASGDLFKESYKNLSLTELLPRIEENLEIQEVIKPLSEQQRRIILHSEKLAGLEKVDTINVSLIEKEFANKKLVEALLNMAREGTHSSLSETDLGTLLENEWKQAVRFYRNNFHPYSPIPEISEDYILMPEKPIDENYQEIPQELEDYIPMPEMPIDEVDATESAEEKLPLDASNRLIELSELTKSRSLKELNDKLESQTDKEKEEFRKSGEISESALNNILENREKERKEEDKKEKEKEVR